MRQQYVPNADMYIKYYVSQANNEQDDQYGYGSSAIVFRGNRYQRGGSFGSIFGRIFRTLLPMFKHALPFLKSGAKHVGKQVLKTGVGVARDVMKGESFKESAKSNFKTMGKNLAGDAMGFASSQMGLGKKRKRRSKSRRRHKASRTSGVKTSPKRKRRKRNHNDIFA